MKYLPLQLFTTFVLAVFVVIEANRPNFRNDYRYEKAFNAFYKIHFSAEPWPVARIRCEAEGAELLVPENLDEGDAIPLLITNILNTYDGVYVGMHDMYSERYFVTINGSAVLATILDLLWEQNEPLHNGGRCVAMRRTGRTFVHPCAKPLPFICKVKANNIAYQKECDTFDSRWKIGFNNTCYMIHEEPQTWYNAYATCISAGGHLVVINNRTEANYIKDMFMQVPERRMPNNDFAFVGFSDHYQRHHYRTVQGQRLEETGYMDWDILSKCDENNNWNSTKNIVRCGGIRRSGLLATEDCNIPSMFVCEKSLNNSSGRKLLRSNNFRESDSDKREKRKTQENNVSFLRSRPCDQDMK